MRIILIVLAALTIVFAQNRESDDFSYPLKLYEQEFYDLAAQQFIKFYTTYPQSDKVDDAKYYAGLALYKIKQYEKARAEFQSLALEFPKSQFAAEAWYLVGDCDEKLGDLKNAAKAYESLRVLYPKDSRASLAIYKAAMINFEHLRDYNKAVELLNILIERYPNSKEYLPALIKKAKVSFELSRIDEAKRLLKKALQIQSDDKKVLAEAYLVLGDIYNLLGFVEKAKKNYKQAVTLGTNSEFAGLAAFQLGRIFIQESTLEPAITLLEQQLKKQSKPEILNRLHYLLADVYFLSGKFKFAEANYKSVQTKDDSLQLILQLKRALCFQKLNFISEAIDILSKAVENYKNHNSRLFNDVYTVYLNFLEDYRYYQQATSSIYQELAGTKDFRSRTQLVTRLAKLLAKKKQWAEIISVIQPFLLMQERFPEKDDILYYFALAKENMSEPKEAAYYYNKLINEFNASKFIPEAKKRLKFLQDFMIVEQDVALNHLAELFGSFLDKDIGTRANLSFKLGQVYFLDLKNYQKAEQQFQKALSLDAEQQGDIYLYLGKTYLKLMEYFDYVGQPRKNYLQLANDQFKKAVQNSASCSRPDESAWMLIQTSLKKDTINIAKEKKLVEALLTKYPNSELKEEWIRSLAIDMAFDSLYTKESIHYFKFLIQNYRNSDQYPQYLLSFARLILPTNVQEAENYLKQLIDGFMFSNEAALALNDLIQLYEDQGRYEEAIRLYEKLSAYFYYSELADLYRFKMGDIYLKAGQYDRAIAFYGNTINFAFINDLILLREFRSAEIFKNIFSLARAYKLSNDSKNALRYYQLYLLVEPKGEFADLAHFEAAELFMKNGQFYLAKENFKAVSDKNEDLYGKAVIYAGDIYFRDQKYNEAAGFYESALKVITDPERKAQINQKYIIALIRQGQIVKANQLIKKFKKAYSKKINALAQFNLELGNYYRLTKNFDKAEKYFSTIKKKYKSSEYVDDAEYYRALVLITLNRHKKALDILTKFAEKFPDSDQLPGVYNTLGTLYFRSEKYDAAITMFKKALDHCNDCGLEGNIMTNLIKVYSLTGFWDAAQAMARSYLDKFPEAPDRLDKKIIIARSYINLNQFQNAVDYLKSIKIEADAEREPEIQFYIGEALLKAGRYEEAIAEFVKIPLLSKKTKLQWEASALYYSGQSYEKLGRIDDAIRMYKEIIKRPGIDLVLKKDAEKRIKQIQ
ncbi:MAG: tetratricopeptide repeat protein [Calditrichaeota bacterium]|nr:tetratricopeptide repeat protein [Calditrichota bacterium]